MDSFSLNNLFLPIKDNEYQLRKHILWMLLLRVCLYTLLISITFFLQAKGPSVILPPLPLIVAFLALIFTHSIASAVLLKKSLGHTRKFGLIQLLTDTVFAAVLVYGTGCSQSIFPPVFILPVVAGGLILYRIGGLIPASTATLLYGLILGCEYFDIIPIYFSDTPYIPLKSPLIGANLFAIYGLIFFLAALLSGQLAGRLRSAEEELTKTALEFDRLSILYKQIFDDISTGIITTDQNDLVTSYNRAAMRITGIPIQDVLGQRFSDFFPEILFACQLQRNVCDYEKKDGTTIRIGYSFSKLNMPVDNMANGQRTNWKVITLQDISQIERMEQQVREAEKMAAIGELSASIAHDFRNPLAAISGSVQLLTMDQADTTPLNRDTFQTLLAIIQRESNRMATTITDFLQFARPAAITNEWFDARRLIDEVISTLSPPCDQLPTEAVIKDITENIGCWGDRQQIQTVLSHLLENACSATTGMPQEILIKARERTSKSDTFICLEVGDKGPGIPQELEKKVFTPFFSTRENGTGLGLAIVKQIIDNHQGKIEITRNHEYGCLMRIFLPLPPSVH